MASDRKMEVRIGAPDSVLEVEIGRFRMDIPRSVGYFGGLAVAVGAGLVEPPLAVFIAAVPLFKALTNSALPLAMRTVGEVFEGAAKPVGSDAEGVVELEDQQQAKAKVVTLPSPAAAARRSTSRRRPRASASR